MLAIIMAIENEADRDKVSGIYKRYSRTMLYIAKSILHDTHLAEDAVSEAFVRIIKNLKKIDTADCYRTRGFVVIIVRNIALDMLRWQNRNQTTHLDENLEYSDDSDFVLDDISAKEAYEKIAERIAGMNKAYSDILYLKYGLGLSDEEIGRMLGISQENVRMRLSRARKSLKDQLQKDGLYYDR